VLQDAPPPGGFPAIRIERRLPSTGPTGVTIFAVGLVVSAYGYYKVGRPRKRCGAGVAEAPAPACCGAQPPRPAGGGAQRWTRRRSWCIAGCRSRAARHCCRAVEGSAAAKLRAGALEALCSRRPTQRPRPCPHAPSPPPRLRSTT
jgi:hypothetical protein